MRAWIIGVLAALFAFSAVEVQADTLLSAGYNIGHDMEESFTLMLREELGDRKYAVGFGWVGPIRRQACPRPDCLWEMKSQMFVSAERIFRLKNLSFVENVALIKNLSFGIGPSYWSRKTVLMSSHLNAKLSVWYDIGKYGQVGIVHFSNGGSGDTITVKHLTRQFNLGLNMVTIDVRF